jgi:hypothetical protein
VGTNSWRLLGGITERTDGDLVSRSCWLELVVDLGDLRRGDGALRALYTFAGDDTTGVGTVPITLCTMSGMLLILLLLSGYYYLDICLYLFLCTEKFKVTVF